MSVLKVKQTTQDGRFKTWKLDSKRKLSTIGSSRKAQLNTLDRLNGPFEGAIEHRKDGWHFINLDLKTNEPDTLITDETRINFHESVLEFKIEDKEEFVKPALETFAKDITTSGASAEKRKLLLVIKDHRLIKTEIRDLKSKLHYTINGVPHILPFNGLESWEVIEIDGFTFKSKIINVSDLKNISQISSEQLVDKESKKMLIATLLAIFLFVCIGLFVPKQMPEQPVAIEKAATNIVVKLDMKKKEKPPEPPKEAVQKSEKVQHAQTTNPQAGGSGGNKVNALLKGAVGVRISQLLGKVSATDARTTNVLVTEKGIKAGEGASGRALSALGKVDASGRNWAGESGAQAGVSTGGIGGGKGSDGLGKGLGAGRTGSGGVGLIEEESEVTGGLDREVIAQYIKTQLGQILYCYERQLSANPELYGKVAVKFTIAGTGQVESQMIGDSTLRSASVEGCILNKISKWKFPEPRGGTKVVVTYPFLFKSTN